MARAGGGLDKVLPFPARKGRPHPLREKPYLGERGQGLFALGPLHSARPHGRGQGLDAESGQ